MHVLNFAHNTITSTILQNPRVIPCPHDVYKGWNVLFVMILSSLNDDCLDQTMKYLQRQSVGRLSQVSLDARNTAERELARRGKTRFKVGERYCTGRHSSSGVRTPFRIMRRTKKNVWFVNENRESRSPKPKRRKVFNYFGKIESFYENSGTQNCVAAWGISSSNVIYS